MSPKLQNFYNAIGQWVDEGCDENSSYFHDSVGLCSNLDGFLSYSCNDEFDFVRAEQATQFAQAGLPHDYPFNGTEFSYNSEINMYKNDKRIEWIESHRSDK